MSRLKYVLVGVVILMTFWCVSSSQEARPGMGEAKDNPGSGGLDPDIVTLLNGWQHSDRVGWALMKRPSLPIGAADLQPVPEYGKAGMLVLVNTDDRSLQDILKAAIGVVPVMLLVNDREELELTLTKIQRLHLEDELNSRRLILELVTAFSPWIRDFGPLFLRYHESGETAYTYVLADSQFVPPDPDEQGTSAMLSGMPEEDKKAAQAETYALNVGDLVPYRLSTLLGMSTVRPPLILSGGNFAADGNGLCFTSTETIEDNGGDRRLVKKVFGAYLGCKDVEFLEPLPGNETTKHIDMFFRVASQSAYLLGEYEPRSNPRTAAEYFQASAHEAMERNRVRLDALLAKHSIGNVAIVRVPMPDLDQEQEGPVSGGVKNLLARIQEDEPESDDEPTWEVPPWRGSRAGQIVYRSFLNYLDLQGGEKHVVLVPDYPGHTVSKLLRPRVRQILQKTFPDADLVFVDSNEVIAREGAVHCMSIVVPADASAYVARVPAKPRKVGTQDDAVAMWQSDEGKVSVEDVVKEYDRLLLMGGTSGDIPTQVIAATWEKAITNLVDRRNVHSELVKLGMEAGSEPGTASWSRRIEELGKGKNLSDPAVRDALAVEAQSESEREILIDAVAKEVLAPPTEDEIVLEYETSEDYNFSGRTTIVWMGLEDSGGSPGAGAERSNDEENGGVAAKRKKVGAPRGRTYESYLKRLSEFPCETGDPVDLEGVGDASMSVSAGRAITDADATTVDPPFRSVILGLSAGMVSEPIETEDKEVILLKVCSRQAAVVRPFEEVRSAIALSLVQKRKSREEQQLLMDLRRRVVIRDTPCPFLERARIK